MIDPATGEETSLNSLDRNGTDKEIRKIFGTIDDFLLTSMSSQMGAMTFINEGSTKRKEILAKFLDLDQFEKKFRASKNDSIETRALLKKLEDNNFENFKISVKASDVFITIESYEKLAQLCDYPFHVGLTEAGTYLSGSIKSSISIGNLLSKGIGDTIRVSLTADPVEEIKVGYEILKSLDLGSRGIKIISCPSCARQAFPVIETVKKLEQRLAHIKTPLTLSIIGCVVNGPGEALKSDIGLTGGGKGNNMIYLSGVADHKITNPEIVDHVVELVEQKVRTIND